MEITEPGAIEGLCFSGNHRPCGTEDHAVVVYNSSIDFLHWPILSGSMDWNEEDDRLCNHPAFGNELTQEKFINVLERVAERENCIITNIELDHVKDFPFGFTTSWQDVIRWIFPMQTMSCSAILRTKEPEDEDAD